jgi:hypothetical protein
LLAISVGPFPLIVFGLPAASENRSVTQMISPRLGQAEFGYSVVCEYGAYAPGCHWTALEFAVVNCKQNGRLWKWLDSRVKLQLYFDDRITSLMKSSFPIE